MDILNDKSNQVNDILETANCIISFLRNKSVPKNDKKCDKVSQKRVSKIVFCPLFYKNVADPPI